MNLLMSIISNPYVIGGVVALVLQRWVAPPVASAIWEDIQAIWNKYFPAKTVP